MTLRRMAPHKRFGVSADVSTCEARRLSTLELTACPKEIVTKIWETIEIHLVNLTYSLDLTYVTSDLVSLQMCQHARPGALAHWNSLLVPKEHVSLLKTNFYYKFNVESANVSTHDARRLSALELTACWHICRDTKLHVRRRQPWPQCFCCHKTA